MHSSMGSDKAAAGADLKEMLQTLLNGRTRYIEKLVIFSELTPIIAAVKGFALGGGCELKWHVIL